MSMAAQRQVFPSLCMGYTSGSSFVIDRHRYSGSICMHYIISIFHRDPMQCTTWVGEDLEVVFTAKNGKSSVPRKFSFAIPTPSSLLPAAPDTRGESVQITGQYFGPPEEEVTVTISGVSCTNMLFT